MEKIRLYNTLSRQVEQFVPRVPGEVGMYCCGPTVYNYAHIGNLRKYVCDDLLRRTLIHAGYRITHVMNLTDVDDKIIAAAPGGVEAIRRYTEPYIEAFFDDLDALGMQRPEIVCRATDHVDDMARIVRTLCERGHAYESEGSYYFRISSFPEYGKLSRADLEGVRPGSRVEADDYEKGDVRDFALWKAPKSQEPIWETVVGPGRPGWHIECSAMSMRHLGPSFDIHTGGVDNIFPHHENEIAQSEGATGQPFVRYWVHVEHLIVEGEKMAKSKGNVYTLRDLLDRGFSPQVVRFVLLREHYRRQLNFTFTGLEQSVQTLKRLHDFVDRLREVRDGMPSGRHPQVESAGLPSEAFAGEGGLAVKIEACRNGFFAALYDDLHMPRALAHLFELEREANTALAQGTIRQAEIDRVLEVMEESDQALGVVGHERGVLEAEIVALIRERDEARARNDFGRADAIRAQLGEMGIELQDGREGTRWVRAEEVKSQK